MQADPFAVAWQARAACFMQSLGAVLDWARSVKGVSADAIELREVSTLQSVASIVWDHRLPVRNASGPGYLDISDMPEAVIRPLDQYLRDLPGYDPALPAQQQASAEPAKQHGYVLFTAQTSLRESLG